MDMLSKASAALQVMVVEGVTINASAHQEVRASPYTIRCLVVLEDTTQCPLCG